MVAIEKLRFIESKCSFPAQVQVSNNLLCVCVCAVNEFMHVYGRVSASMCPRLCIFLCLHIKKKIGRAFSKSVQLNDQLETCASRAREPI